MESVRDNLTGLSKTAQDLILGSWSSGTTKNYNVYIREWSNFLAINNISADRAINDVMVGIEFLSYLFEHKKFKYSAINSARSALSVFINTGNHLTFGKQDLVVKFMKGVFRQRPSLPKYTVTYDAEVVLNHLALMPRTMTLKQVTHKVATLLCFLTGQRNQTINELDIDFMHAGSDGLVFYIPTILKTTTPRSHQEPLVLKSYPDNPALCIVLHINLYIAATQNVRKSKKLLLSYVPPYGPVTTSTVSRWVKQTLGEAGINIHTFSAHSTRSSSSSAAKAKGLSVNEIRKAAGWKGTSTFATFYDKPIIKNFGETILM